MSKKNQPFETNTTSQGFKKNQDLNSRRVVKNDRLEQKTNEIANNQILKSVQR
mgnify:CR=1 FL=1